MIIFVFDLDYTLYYLPNWIQFEYKLLKKNKNLNSLFETLKDKKYIFTSATLKHTNKVLKKLELDNIFDKIETCDTLNGYKPNINIYHKFIDKCSISKQDEIYFFEDRIENLEIAKKFNWITIYICGPYSQYLNKNNLNFNLPDYIDYIFKDIRQAMEYFYNLNI